MSLTEFKSSDDPSRIASWPECINMTPDIVNGLMILATLLSPLIAVQVSQFLERRRTRTAEQMRLFQTLMSTRAANLDPRHVEALNSIDIVFGGTSKGETSIRRQWKQYLDHLNTPGANNEAWLARRVDYMIELLHPMGVYLGFDFDKTHLKNQTYLPQGHLEVENEQATLRTNLVALLNGETRLRISVDPPEFEEGIERLHELADQARKR